MNSGGSNFKMSVLSKRIAVRRCWAMKPDILVFFRAWSRWWISDFVVIPWNYRVGLSMGSGTVEKRVK